MKKVEAKKPMTTRERVRASARRQLSETAQPWNRYVKVPEGMEQFVPKANQDGNKFMFRIIPYVIKDARNNPDCDEKGAMWWKRRFWVHKNVGPKKLTVVCPNHTFGTNCPICNEVTRMRRSDEGYSDEEIREMNAKSMAMYFIRLKGETDVKLFVTSTFTFDDKLTEEIDDPDNEGADALAEMEGGKMLRCRFKKAKGKGYSYLTLGSVAFLDTKDLDPKVIKGLDLDSVLIETSEEELEKMLEGVASTSAKPAKKGKKVVEADDGDDDGDADGDDDDGDDDDEDEKPAKGKGKTAKNASAKGKGKKAVEEDGNDDDSDSDDDADDADGDDDDDSDSDDSDDDEDEKPAKGKAKGKGKKDVEADDDDGDDDDDSDSDDDDDDGDSDDDDDEDSDSDDDDDDSDSDDDDDDSDDDDDEDDDGDSDDDDDDDGDSDDDDDEDEKPAKGRAKAKPAKKAPAKGKKK